MKIDSASGVVTQATPIIRRQTQPIDERVVGSRPASVSHILMESSLSKGA